MNRALCFDDVLLIPQYSDVKSRADVNLSSNLLGIEMKIPIISSNMDTITECDMAWSMRNSGGIGCLHRFMNLYKNVEQYKKTNTDLIVSVGIGNNELERAQILYNAGARLFCLDVANAASSHVKECYEVYRKTFQDTKWIVGNFATFTSYQQFCNNLEVKPEAIKVGISSGSKCSTAIVTGCGMPTLASLLDFQLGFSNGYFDGNHPTVIADGGIKSSGDIVKSIAAGADFVMLGGLLSGTSEAPAEVVNINGKYYATYRGSASRQSYEVQGKIASHRTAEGESGLVELKGSVKNVLESLAAGIRSGYSYVGAYDTEEFKRRAVLMEITNSGVIESRPK